MSDLTDGHFCEGEVLLNSRRLSFFRFALMIVISFIQY